jgi:hypothetical protein
MIGAFIFTVGVVLLFATPSKMDATKGTSWGFLISRVLLVLGLLAWPLVYLHWSFAVDSFLGYIPRFRAAMEGNILVSVLLLGMTCLISAGILKRYGKTKLATALLLVPFVWAILGALILKYFNGGVY